MSFGKKIIFLELCVCKPKAHSVLNGIEKEVASPKGVGGGSGQKKKKKKGKNERIYKMNLERFQS